MDITLNGQSKLTITGEAAYVTFPEWNVPGYVHFGYSSRMLGASKGIYAAMNLGFNRGDDRETVLQNYRKMTAALGIGISNLVLPKQTHSLNVRKVTKPDCGNGIERENAFEDVDALMTDENGVALMVFTADCVPVFLFDPVKRVIALAHAGWRGTVGGICRETLRAMHREYGSEPKDVLAAIGPSICRGCFEIGPEVAEEFLNVFPEEKDEVLFPGEGDRSFADLWKANEIMLMREGVRKENITVSGLCTMCRPQLFFSHRATQGKRGSNAGFLMLGEVSE
ncbi:MAG: peptidoglycan editing factor PgeF [Lachnospiraceae bacterium]|nr:peptidoglycan editing factor PgeF [Lachnospiraceae bacterium]